MTRLLPTLVRIGSLGPTGPRFWASSSADAEALATVRASTPAAAKPYNQFLVNGFIFESPFFGSSLFLSVRRFLHAAALDRCDISHMIDLNSRTDPSP